MPKDSVGAGDADSCAYNQSGRSCYMPQDSVGAGDADSYEYNQGDKDCYMPQDSEGAEDDYCYYSQSVRTATFPKTA